MKCFDPVKVWLTKEAREKRIRATYMPLEWRYTRYVMVPCGKCPACLSKKRVSWAVRLFQEVKTCESCYFITLTYDEDHIPYKRVDKDIMIPTVSKKDVQLFLKRLRKRIEPFKIRYFLVSEYGPQTFRPHYHMILFNFPQYLNNKLDEILTDAWQSGFITVAPVNDARINYVSGYCLDGSTLPEIYTRNFMLCSRRPGIGSTYLDNDNVVNFHINNLSDFFMLPNGGNPYKVKMPRYYSDRIFNDQQRNAICNKNIEYHIKSGAETRIKQRKWLRENGYTGESVESLIHAPIPGSPVDLELQAKERFRERVEKKCKMKKNN